MIINGAHAGSNSVDLFAPHKRGPYICHMTPAVYVYVIYVVTGSRLGGVKIIHSSNFF